MGEPKLMPDRAHSAVLFEQLSKDEAGYLILADYLKRMTGIHMPLTSKNLTLMASRLTKIMPRHNIKSYRAMYRELEAGNTIVYQAFVEALTTNKTEFFRENIHFSLLPKMVEDRLNQRKVSKKPFEFRVWCAAASRGHEPYSILFTLLEKCFDPNLIRLRFLATDIDLKVLNEGAKGIYPENQLDIVPPLTRERFMREVAAKDGQRRFQVKEEYRNMITFAQFNLVEMPYHFQNPFDIVFCRNVLIYFDRDMVRRVKDSLTSCVEPGGYLIIGHSESGGERPFGVDTVADAVYKKRGGGAE